MRRIHLLGWLLVFSALILAGCAGGDETDATPTPADTPGLAATRTALPTTISPSVGRIAYEGDGIWAIDADGANETQLTDFGASPAWSPDGLRIAFARLSPEESERGIWVVDADGSNESRLTDGDDAMPTWSPDGSKIAFTRGLGKGDVYIAEADGSNQTRLAVDGWWPAWSPDGSRIAFLRGSSIYVIKTDGSEETLVATLTTDFRPPAWSPDGSRLAYSVSEEVEEEPGIYVVNRDGSNRMRLTNGGRVPSWSPDGSRIISGELYLVAADGSNATQLQPATPLGGDSQTAVWSPDASRIAYKCDPEPKYHGRLCVMNADGSDARVLTENIFYLGTFEWQPKTGASTSSADDTPTAMRPTTPDLRREEAALKVAYIARSDDLSDASVMVADIQTGQRHALATGLHSPVSLAWSPDGLEIAVCTLDRLWLLRADGGGARDLKPKNVGCLGASWSPDGARLAIDVHASGIVIVNRDGTGLLEISAGEWQIDRAPSWAPGGQQIVFVSGLAGSRPVPPTDLYVANADGTGLRQLTDDAVFELAPRWSPDGRLILYQGYEGPEGGPPTPQQEGMYVFDTRTGESRRLRDRARSPVWSPNGSSIAFVYLTPDEPPKAEIRLTGPLGERETQVAGPFACPFDSSCRFGPDLAWSADGSRLAFTVPAANGSAVFVVNVDGTGLLQVDEGAGNKYSPAWSPAAAPEPVSLQPLDLSAKGATLGAKTGASAPLTDATPTTMRPATETAPQLPGTRPRVTYTGDLMEYVERTQSVPPSPHAMQVKQAVLQAAGIPEGGAGVITTQRDFEIGYVGGPDVFMVEIRSSDLEGAKMAAEQWLVDQGFTPQDFCSGIALSFFVGPGVREEPGSGTIFFDPVPTACK